MLKIDLIRTNLITCKRKTPTSPAVFHFVSLHCMQLPIPRNKSFKKSTYFLPLPSFNPFPLEWSQQNRMFSR